MSEGYNNQPPVQSRGRRQRLSFVIYEPIEFVESKDEIDTVWIETGMAIDQATAERFIKKLKNAIVRDVITDNIVLVKKEN